MRYNTSEIDFPARPGPMRVLVTPLLSPLLVLLLMVTTPVGTGSGVHQGDLLHPLLPHVHLVNGKIVAHDQSLEQVQQEPVAHAGPAIGAGAGAEPIEVGLALSPTLPLATLAIAAADPDWRVVFDLTAPRGRVDTPPDPPPTAST
jgi:hypothetical protein